MPKTLIIFAIIILISFGQVAAQDDDHEISDEGIQFFNGNWNEALAIAVKENKPIFLDVYASWCGPCKALKKNRNDSVLWLNGDVVFDGKLLSLLNAHILSEKSFVAVNTSKVAEEEVKYTLKDGYIDQLSKTVKNGLGEAVGINFIAQKDIVHFIDRLEACDDNDYFERGLEMAIEHDGVQISAIDISEFDCVEVDFREDLENANTIFQK